jgi:hypothetical protein
MNAKNPTFWISACVVALLAEPGVTQAQTRADAEVVTAISNLENDAVKADLAGDAAGPRPADHGGLTELGL